MSLRLSVVLFLALITGCAAAKRTGPPLVEVPNTRGPTTVVLEPFFEQARTEIVERASNAQVSPIGGGLYGGGFYGPQSVTVIEKVEQKPLLAQPAVLAQLHGMVMQELKRRRPDWDVLSTSVLTQQTSGNVVLVRTVVGDTVTVSSDRSLRNLSFGFGLIIPPLLILAFQPVHEAQRVYGSLFRYETDASAFKSKLLRYPTQPDFAVDTRGVPFREQPFGLDTEYEEGIFANDRLRDPVLIDGFAAQLAGAIIALVEGV
ncbi:MAG: hypothetical protein ACJ790_17220 [Myxococcaceae bacterium]